MSLFTKATAILFLTCTSILSYAQTCIIDGPKTVCVGEAYTYTLDIAGIDFDKLTSAAFTVQPGLDIPAQINSTSSTSTLEVVWFAGGAGEVEVVLSLDGQPVQLCQIEVEVFGDGFYPTFGGLSSPLGDTISACRNVDIPVNTLTACTDCTISWTLNNEDIQPDLLYEPMPDFILISGNIPVEGIGSYDLCYALTLPDGSCSVEDCIVVLITELSGIPSFQSSAESSICSGLEVLFTNTTVAPEDSPIRYQWSVKLDTVQWTYVTEDLVFNFSESGQYEISLQYFLAADPSCTSTTSTMQLSVTDQSSLPVSCNTDQCDELLRTYRTLNLCSNYTWTIDQENGSIVSGQGTPEVTVQWLESDLYTYASLTLSTEGCPTQYCNVTETYVKLYPNTITIAGDRIKCGSGKGMYFVNVVPNSTVAWSVEAIATVSGASPTLVAPSDYEAEVSFGNFLGTIEVVATMTFGNGDCMVSDTFETQKVSVQLNATDICPGEAIIANVLPPLNEPVTWSITDPIPSTTTVEQLASSPLFYTGTSLSGIYELDLRFENGGEFCDDISDINVYSVKPLILEGPRVICDGDSAAYSLVSVTDADDVLWTVFINGSQTTFTGPEIAVGWPAGGFGFTIRVELTSPVAANIDCGTAVEVVPIQVVDGPQSIQVTGPTMVCRDATEVYEITGDNISTPVWSVEPAYIGSIIAGDSTRQVTVKWHFADLDTEAMVICDYTSCGAAYRDTVAIKFRENEAAILGPIELCRGTQATYSIPDIDTFSMIMWYVDGELRNDQGLKTISSLLSGLEEGPHTISVVVEDLNGCPGLASTQLSINLLPFARTPSFTFDKDIPACPDQFEEDIVATLENLEADATYQWYTDNILQAEALGADWSYSELLTIDDFLNNTLFQIVYTAPNGCSRALSFRLQFVPGQLCECDEVMEGSVDFIEFVACNTLSFGGTLNWEELSTPQLVVFGSNFEHIVNIESEDDLRLDSLLLEGDLPNYTIGFRNGCPGVLIDLCSGDTITQDTCFPGIYEAIEDPTDPSVNFNMECDEDNNYTITAIESLSEQEDPLINFDIYWEVNGTTYEEDTLQLSGIPPDSLLIILVTVVNLDDDYSCTLETTMQTPDFDPEILVTVGPCGDDTWELQPTTDISDVFDIYWDFSDGSGSTLYSTEKAFDADSNYLITMTVSSFDGCVATDTLTPFTIENTLAGALQTDAVACQDTAVITFTNLSDREIVEYRWSNGVVTDIPSLNVGIAGSYGLVVTDEFTCRLDLDPIIANVNLSFPTGIRGQKEACGATALRITPVDSYTYMWFVNGEEAGTEANLIINQPGSYTVSVLSIETESNVACDTLTTSVTVHPLPALPVFTETLLYCDPPLIEYTATSYDSVLWTGSNIITQLGPSIQIAQNGTYRARYTDENGCTSTSLILQDEQPLDFELMPDYCIQYCREDLDSLAISVEGVPGSFPNWTWSTFDINGQPYTISEGSGTIGNITIDGNMYDLLFLQVDTDSCSYHMDPIFLDIITCDEPPALPCLELTAAVTADECLLSSDNGGPLYDLVLDLEIPQGFTICNEDSIAVLADIATLLDTEYTLELDSSGNHFLQINTGLVIDSVDTYLNTGIVLSTTYCDEEGKERCILYDLSLDSCIVPPMDTCIIVNEFSHECGMLDFKCLRPDAYGGVRYQFTSRLRVPPAYEMCDAQELKLTFNAGTIEVLSFRQLTALNGDLLVEYESIIDITNDSLFEAGGAYIGSVFCSKENKEAQCIDYLFPFTSCSSEFDCGATYTGLDYSPYGVQPEMLYYTYCLSLSDIVTADCQLSQYEIVATIEGDLLKKEILREVYEGAFDTVYCLQLPILEADFESSDYYCLEIEIVGDCPVAQCGYYDCTMLMPASHRSMSQTTGIAPSQQLQADLTKDMKTQGDLPSVSVHPNPAINTVQIEIIASTTNSYDLSIYSSSMQTMAQHKVTAGAQTVDVSSWHPGLYHLTISKGGVLLTSKRLIVVR